MRRAIGVLLGVPVLLAAAEPLPVKAATLQEQLDGGRVELHAQSALYLRANQTYYLGFKGAKGGTSGDTWCWYPIGNGYGDLRLVGSVDGTVPQARYYKVSIGSSDVRMEVAFGTPGSAGSYEPRQDELPGGPLNDGGSGGKNNFNYGNGSDGGSSGGKYPACAGGGGGGGGASIIKFNNDINQRLVAPGGQGGIAKDTINYAGSPYDKFTASGGTGGAGGNPGNTTISGVTWQEVSEAEAVAYSVGVYSENHLIIQKKFTITSTKVKFQDIPVGSHFVLVNTKGFASLFIKINATEARIIDGSTETEYRTGTATTKQWYDFPDYALATRWDSQSGYYLYTIRADALFVGGDGTRYKPFYAEKVLAGGGSGGSSQDYSEKYDQIVNSLIYAGEKQHEVSEATSAQTQYLERQAEAAEQQLQVLQEQAKSAKKPQIKSLGLRNGAIIATSQTVDFDLAVEASGWQDQQLTVYLSEDGGTWVSKGSYSGTVRHSFPSSGRKTVRIKVVDPNGAYDVATVSFFIK